MKIISVDRNYVGLTLIPGSWRWTDGTSANSVPWYPRKPCGGDDCAELLDDGGNFGINDIDRFGSLTKGALWAVKLTYNQLQQVSFVFAILYLFVVNPHPTSKKIFF